MVDAAFSLTVQASRLPDFDRFKLFREDCVEWLGSLPRDSVDLCVTDPAYESLEKYRAIGTTTRLTNEWFPIFPNARFVEFFRELYRVMKRNTHVYVFTDVETMFVVRPVAELAGFTWWDPLVFDKIDIGMGYHYRKRYEMICFLEKGKRRLMDLSIPNILAAKRVRDGYPTEKPVEVIDTLVRQSTNVGDLVIDPFFGSGATAVSALGAGRRFLGSDINELAHRTAEVRLAEIAQ